MKPKPRNRDYNYEPRFPKPSVPSLTKSELQRHTIVGLDTEKMRRLAHNAVMWCDHEGGTILNQSSNPFSAILAMENRDGNVEAYFHFQTSPYSNGSLAVHVWYQGKLVFAATDAPGAVYKYPSDKINITTYKHGGWEKFLEDKGYEE